MHAFSIDGFTLTNWNWAGKVALELCLGLGNQGELFDVGAILLSVGPNGKRRNLPQQWMVCEKPMALRAIARCRGLSSCLWLTLVSPKFPKTTGRS